MHLEHVSRCAALDTIIMATNNYDCSISDCDCVLKLNC